MNTIKNLGYESNDSNLNNSTIPPKIESKSQKVSNKNKVLNKTFLTKKMDKQNANNNYSYIVSDDLKIIVQPIIPKNSSKTIHDIIIENIKKEQEIIKSKAITRKYVHDYSNPFIDID